MIHTGHAVVCCTKLLSPVTDTHVCSTSSVHAEAAIRLLTACLLDFDVKVWMKASRLQTEHHQGPGDVVGFAAVTYQGERLGTCSYTVAHQHYRDSI